MSANEPMRQVIFLELENEGDWHRWKEKRIEKDRKYGEIFRRRGKIWAK